MTDPDRPTLTVPYDDADRWRREWPRDARVEYLVSNWDREDIVRRLLTSDEVAPLVSDPWRQLDNSARLHKRELAAVLVALSTPRTPLP
jgi:hypothetical protein